MREDTFITHSGLYEFNVMSFGLCNAATTFQRLVQRVLMGLQSFCSVYINDIMFSASPEEHVEHLRQIFRRLKRFDLKLQLEKCQFRQSRGERDSPQS